MVKENGDRIARTLKTCFGVDATPVCASAGAADVIVVSDSAGQAPSVYTATGKVSGTQDGELYRLQAFGPPGSLVYRIPRLAPGLCTVELLFAETFWEEPGKRVFDVAINGQRVLRDFDIFRDAGGKNRAVVKQFEVNAPDGVVTVSSPAVKVDYASFFAIKVTDSQGRVTAVRCAGDPYTGRDGTTWGRVPTANLLTPDLLARTRAGARLVLWPDDWRAAESFAQTLAGHGVLSYEGMVGENRVCWAGAWYFVRKHWLFGGLPTDCAMDWRYQVSCDGANGLLLSAPGMQVAAAYGRDHDANVGIAACVIPCGKGEIVLFCLPGLAGALDKPDQGVHMVVARRLLGNALRGG